MDATTWCAGDGMKHRRTMRDLIEVIEDSGYLCEPDDLPGSVARALDEAWRNGYCVGFDEAASESDVIADGSEIKRLISEADALVQALSRVVADLRHVAHGDPLH